MGPISLAGLSSSKIAAGAPGQGAFLHLAHEAGIRSRYCDSIPHLSPTKRINRPPTLGISAAASTSHHACVLYCLARRNLPNRRLGNQKKNEPVIRDLPERTMSFKEKGKPPPVLSYSSSSANARTSYTTNDPLPRSKGRNSCITVTKVSYGIGIACAG